MNAIEKALEDLGSTVSEVATTLHRKGIKGRPQMTRSCPLANYLRDCGFGNAAAGITTASGINRRGKRVRAKMPDACQTFVSDFDSRMYPGLIGDYV